MRRVLLSVVLACSAWPAAAQFAKPEEAVRYRQGAWSLLHHHFARIGAMARGRVPYDPPVAVREAELVAMLARLPGAAFAPGTDLPSDGARPEVWTEHARFRDYNQRLLADTTKLVAAARTQNLDQLKAAWGAAANTCKECHDAYRSH